MARKNDSERKKAYDKEFQKTYWPKYYLKNKERIKKQQLEHYYQNRKRNPRYKIEATVRAKKHRVKMKELVFSNYGGKCNCCEESNMKFLTIDHVNNKGREHVRSNGKRYLGFLLYKWARDNNYPDSLQVLCFNCNCGKQVNGGVCPHKA